MQGERFLTPPLSHQTYSVCPVIAGKTALAPHLLDAFRRAGRRPWIGAPGSQALKCSRAVTVLFGPGWQDQVESARTLVRAAHTLHGERLPVISVLLPGCGLSLREAEAQLESGGRAIDLRRDTSWAALNRLAIRVPPVCAPLRPRPAFTADPMKAATVESYDTIAAQFAGVWTEHPPLAAIEKLLALIPAGSTILDAGCGPGHHSRYLARRGHDVMGVDLSEEMLGIARRSFFPLRFIRMDIEHLQFTTRFDAVWCAAAAMHVPRERMPALLRNFRAVLRPRGVLGLNLQVGRPSEVVCFGADQRFFEYYAGQDEIAAMVRQAGFEVLDTDQGETTRNTHAAPLTLRWITLYARPRMRGRRPCRDL